MKVIVYPADILNHKIQPIQEDDFKIEFGDLATCPPFYNYDLVILPFAAHMDSSRSSVQYPGEFSKRLRETETLLSKHDRMICFLFGTSDVEPKEKHGDFSTCKQMDVPTYVLDSLGVGIESMKGTHPVKDIKRAEFEQFFQRYGMTRCFFSVPESVPVTQLATLSGKVVAFSHARQILCLPTNFAEVAGSEHGQERVKDFYTVLVQAIKGFRSTMQLTIPAWLEEFQFKPEEPLVKREKELQTELEEVKKNRDSYDRYKLALVCRGDELVNAVMDIFQRGFSIPVERKEQFKEDFWLLDPEKNKKVLIEVKGLNANITRETVSQANFNRDRCELPDEFPALVIVNTAMKTTSLKEKDQSIHPEIVKYARKLNVKVMRTLDLLTLLNSQLEAPKPADEWLEFFMTSSGWIKA